VSFAYEIIICKEYRNYNELFLVFIPHTHPEAFIGPKHPLRIARKASELIEIDCPISPFTLPENLVVFETQFSNDVKRISRDWTRAVDLPRNTKKQ
jgi:hypothetical protein